MRYLVEISDPSNRPVNRPVKTAYGITVISGSLDSNLEAMLVPVWIWFSPKTVRESLTYERAFLIRNHKQGEEAAA